MRPVFWVIAAGWGIAVLVALVVLGFCGYELTWKSARLRRDLRGLQGLRLQLTDIQGQLAQVQERARRGAD